MIRRHHFFFDLRNRLGSPFLLGLIVVTAGGLMLFVSFQFVYPSALLIAAIFALRGLIGRRCPHCDGPLKEVGAERDKTNAFVMLITWRCPRDGYQEIERTKGDAGLFGTG